MATEKEIGKKGGQAKSAAKTEAARKNASKPRGPRVSEKGKWSLYTHEGKIGVASDDFTHDAILWISGDFADDAQRTRYAKLIAQRLNAVDVNARASLN